MTLDELHTRVRAFVAERDWARYHSPRNLAMALSVEAAELLEVYLWTADGEPPTAEQTTRAADEAADVMICLLNLCDRAGIDLGAAVVEKLARAAEKYPADQVRGRSLKYDQYPSWDGERHVPLERHHLDAATAPPDLSPEALRVLVERGLPAVLQLARGQTLFRSAMSDGRLRTTDGGYIIGSTPATEGGSSEFVLRVAEGDVVLLELPEQRIRTVNRSLAAFVDAIEAFHARQVDPGAFDDLDGYWAMWMVEISG